MTLQPVVENALYHGIKNKRGGGKISIRGYGNEEKIFFEVEDNGIGMDQATLTALNKKLKSSERPSDTQKGSFGLYNVVQRIRMYYGNQSDLTIISEKGAGTRVCICLGLSEKNDLKKT